MIPTGKYDTSPLIVRVLGPLTVVRNHVEIDLGSPIQQAVLLPLVLYPGRIVAPGTIIDGVWGEAVPASGIKTVRTYISRLRLVLDKNMIVHRTGGYCMHLDPSQVDLTLFERHVSEARELRRHDRFESSVMAWRKALELWRGPPLPGIPGPFAESKSQRLTEQRRSAYEECWDTELLLGRHCELLAELSAAARDHPTRENLTRLLMIAYQRSGRQADAIAAFKRTELKLTQELGLKPRPDLQQLYDRIRSGDLD